MILKIHKRHLDGMMRWCGWKEVHSETGFRLIYDPQDGESFYEVKSVGPEVELHADEFFVNRVKTAAEECLRQLRYGKQTWWSKLFNFRHRRRMHYAYHCLNGVLMDVS